MFAVLWTFETREECLKKMKRRHWTFRQIFVIYNGPAVGGAALSEGRRRSQSARFQRAFTGPLICTLESWSPSFQRSADDIGEAKWHGWFIPVVLMRGKFEMFETLWTIQTSNGYFFWLLSFYKRINADTQHIQFGFVLGSKAGAWWWGCLLQRLSV